MGLGTASESHQPLRLVTPNHSLMSEFLDLGAYTCWLRAAGRPETTIDLRTYHLRRAARDVPDLMNAGTEALTEWLGSQRWAASTKRSYRSSLTVYFGWANRTGRITADPTIGMPRVTPPLTSPRPASDTAVANAILRANPRVKLMIRVQATAGLRRGEVARIHARDLQHDHDGYSLHVTGKGGRERIVPLLPIIGLEIRERGQGYLFPSPQGGHLTPAHVGKLISAALGPGVVPHQLRHRFATRAYAVSQDLLTVQQLLGHSKPETTMIYTQVPTAAKRRIVDAAA